MYKNTRNINELTLDNLVSTNINGTNLNVSGITSTNILLTNLTSTNILIGTNSSNSSIHPSTPIIGSIFVSTHGNLNLVNSLYTNGLTSSATGGSIQFYSQYCDFGDNYVGSNAKIQSFGNAGYFGGYLSVYTNTDESTLTEKMRIGDEIKCYRHITLPDSSTQISAGNLKITNATLSSLNLTSTSNVLKLNRLTTTQRDVLTAENGDIFYNTTLNKFQVYENNSWQNLI